MNEANRASPLAKRPRDWFFVIAFSFFAFTSAASDIVHSMGWIDGHSMWAQANHAYAQWAGDDFLLADNDYARVTTAISGFVYGPFYLVLVYAFVRGRNWIRVPSFIYAGAILHGMIEYTAWEFWIGPAPANPVVFWCFNGPYALVPLLLIVRMWGAGPFDESE